MAAVTLGRIVNTGRYSNESLQDAIREFNAKPASARVGEDCFLGYGFMVSKHNPRESQRRLRTIDIDNVVVSDLQIVPSTEGYLLTGVKVQSPGSALPDITTPVWGLRCEAQTGLERERIIKIIAVDLVGTATPTLDLRKGK